MVNLRPGNVWRGAAAAKWSWSWAAGDAADNPEYVNQEASMTETEMLKEPRIIVAKVAHADQASGRRHNVGDSGVRGRFQVAH